MQMHEASLCFQVRYQTGPPELNILECMFLSFGESLGTLRRHIRTVEQAKLHELRERRGWQTQRLSTIVDFKTSKIDTDDLPGRWNEVDKGKTLAETGGDPECI